MIALEMKGKFASIRQIRYGTFPSPPSFPKEKQISQQKTNKFELDRWMDG